jgi:hypothetical protein
VGLAAKDSGEKLTTKDTKEHKGKWKTIRATSLNFLSIDEAERKAEEI